jgi:predicted AAA+ superfamily ATPase
MINRKAERHLDEWYRSRRRKPLVLRGARQVGKSTLVRQFAANNICGNDWILLESIDDRGLVNEGGLAEQFIGQHLVNPHQAPQLTYWLREAKTSNAEVDYVISRGNLIVPVEVKAGKSGSLKSLQQFVYRKRAAIAVRFDLNPPSVQNVKNVIRTKEGNREIEYALMSFPLYLVSELTRILDDWRRAE